MTFSLPASLIWPPQERAEGVKLNAQICSGPGHSGLIPKFRGKKNSKKFSEMNNKACKKLQCVFFVLEGRLGDMN